MSTRRLLYGFGAALVMLGLCAGMSRGQNQPPTQPRTLTQPGSPAPATPPPKPLPSLLDPATDVRGAIDAAKKAAEAQGKRVLVVWASDPDREFTRLLVDVFRSSDMRRLVGLEFEPVWAETGKSEKAPSNIELAKSLGVEVKGGDDHAVLSVIDPATGKVVASKSASEMLDALRRRAYSVMKIEDYLNANKAAAPAAQAVLDGALQKAKSGGKCVLLTFGEHGDEWVEKFNRWLAQPEVVRAMDKTIVVAYVEMLRNKGGSDLMEKLGGVKVETLPWFVVLSADGKPLAASQTEKIPNIGFPTDDGEITEFLAILKKGAPGLSDADTRVIRDSLVEHRKRKG